MSRDTNFKDRMKRERKPRSILQRKQKQNDSGGGVPDRFGLFLSSLGNGQVARLFGGGQIQTKLDLSSPGDIYEQQADKIAGQLVRMQPGNKILEPKIDSIQAKGGGGGTVPGETGQQIKQLSGRGTSLSRPLRDFFEPRLGVDLGNVRVHTGENANALARSVNARAFTYQNEIVFGKGEYQPGSDEGRKLIGHELVHTVQQGEVKSKVQRDRYGDVIKEDFPELSDTYTNIRNQIDELKQLMSLKNIPYDSSDFDPIRTAFTSLSSEDKTEILDKLTKLYIDGIQLSRIAGGDIAAGNLEYFLEGSGKTKVIPVTWLRNFGLILDGETINQRRYENQLKEKALSLKSGESIDFDDINYSDDLKYGWHKLIDSATQMGNKESRKEYMELFLASGNSELSTFGQFHLSRNDDIVTISGTLIFRWSDPYDWHPGLDAFGMPDSWQRLMQEYKGANPFLMESYWRKSVTGTLNVKMGSIFGVQTSEYIENENFFYQFLGEGR